MEPLEIAKKIQDKFPDEVQDIIGFRGQTGVLVKKDRIEEICSWLHDDSELQMDHLLDLCGSDYLNKKEPRFEVVYNLYSIPLKHMIRIRALVPEEDCNIQSVTSVWKGANWHERETYDMYGIVFEGHPDLSRILMPDDWEGHPLRKDYPVTGPEKEWSGFEKVKEKAKELSKYDFYEGKGLRGYHE